MARILEDIENRIDMERARAQQKKLQEAAEKAKLEAQKRAKAQNTSSGIW
jgi:hypothetical protein